MVPEENPLHDPGLENVLRCEICGGRIYDVYGTHKVNPEEKGDTMSKPIELTIVSDIGSGEQCLYIDGKVYDAMSDGTVYACDVYEAADDKPCVIKWLGVD